MYITHLLSVHPAFASFSEVEFEQGVFPTVNWGSKDKGRGCADCKARWRRSWSWVMEMKLISDARTIRLGEDT